MSKVGISGASVACPPRRDPAPPPARPGSLGGSGAPFPRVSHCPPTRVTLSSPPSAGHGGRRLRVSPAQVHRAVLRLRAEDAGQKPQGGGDPFQFHQQVPGLAATLGQGRGKGPT